MVSAGVVGGSGYTGIELLRLLSGHPEVRVDVVTSRENAGRPVAEVIGELRGVTDLRFSEPSGEALQRCDVVFFATPNGTAMEMAPSLVEAGVRVIDIGADFRLRDADEFERWYEMPHRCPELLEQAVYGLPEMYRGRIREASVVGNPGCYPTCALLGFLPLVERGLVATDSLIASVVSGLTGAGRGAKTANLFAEVNDNFVAYGTPQHRHHPEMRAALDELAGGGTSIVFLPHRAPMIRGMHASLYARRSAGEQDLQAIFEARYADEPFVDVLPSGSHPETRSVRGSNACRLAVYELEAEGTIVVLSVIDNLTKGAAGQAVQNMNIMLGVDETVGLSSAGLVP